MIKTIERDFTGCELFKEVGECKIYYPTSESKSMEFMEIIQAQAQLQGEKGIDTNKSITLDDKNVIIDLFNLMTNIDFDDEMYETHKDKLGVKLATVLNWMNVAINDSLELMKSGLEAEESNKRMKKTLEVKTTESKGMALKKQEENNKIIKLDNGENSVDVKVSEDTLRNAKKQIVNMSKEERIKLLEDLVDIIEEE